MGKRKWMILFGALTLFSVGSVGMLANADPTPQIGMYGGVMVREATPSEVPHGKEITLDAGEGGTVNPGSVYLTTEGNLPDNLPTPERKGWTFEGWYTEPPIEVYLSGGDETGNGGYSDPNQTKEKIIEEIKKELKGAGVTGAEVAEMSEAKILGMQYQCYTGPAADAKEGRASEKFPGDGNVLYALYTPNQYDIIFWLNGWQNKTSAFITQQRRTGSMCWSLNPNGTRYPSSNWPDRTFLGWSLEKGGEVVLKVAEPDQTGGYVYRVGDEQVPLPEEGNEEEGNENDDAEKKNDINFYAVWEGGEEVDSISLRADKIYHDKDEWKVVVYYSAKPSGANAPDVAWSVDREDIGAKIDPYWDPREKKATLSVKNTKQIGEHIENVTVTVTAQHGVEGSITIPIGHSWSEEFRHPATCEGSGYVGYKCQNCGQTLQVTLPQIDHVFSSKDIPATCDEPGYVERICKFCGKTEKEQKGTAAGHKWGKPVIEEGCGGIVTTTTCTVCGYVETVSYGDVHHTWAEEATVDKEPTCVQEGSKSVHCLLCSATKENDAIPPTGNHSWTEWFVQKKPEVGQAGLRSRYCNYCTIKEEEEIEALVAPPESVEDNYTSVPTPSQPGYSDSSSDDDDDDSYSSGSGSGNSSSGGAAASVPAGATLPAVPSAAVRASMPTYVEVGRWNQAADGSWTFRDETGEPCKNRWAALYNPYAHVAEGAEIYDWFRFDEAGNMITGWYVDPLDGNTYYMNTESDGTKGRMVTGWIVIDGKEYYFNTSSDGTKGRMYHNEMTPDGHFVGPDGVKIR